MEINEVFFKPQTKIDILQITPLALAFVGDAVHTMYIRDYVVKSSIGKIGDYHSICAKFCKAKTQAQVLDNILSTLDQTELDIVRRARNVKSHNIAKNADIVTYKKATSFEALIGYLYLIGNFERMEKILKSSLIGE